MFVCRCSVFAAFLCLKQFPLVFVLLLLYVLLYLCVFLYVEHLSLYVCAFSHASASSLGATMVMLTIDVYAFTVCMTVEDT